MFKLLLCCILFAVVYGKIGLYHANAPKLAVPLQSIRIVSHVIDFVYYNDLATAIETVFTFPMDDNVIVTGIEAHVNNMTIVTQVQELAASRATYAKAVRAGRFAVHASMRTDDLYTIKLGNLPAHSYANVTIRAVTELKAEGHGYRFILPTAITPRYVPRDTPREEAAKPEPVELLQCTPSNGNFTILKKQLAMKYWNGASFTSDWVGDAIHVDSELYEEYDPVMNKSAVFFVNPEGYLSYYRYSQGKYDLDSTSFRLIKAHKQGPIRPLYEPRRNAICAFVRGADNKLHYVYWNANQFVIDSVSFEPSAGKLGHDFAAVFEPDRNHAALYYVSQNGLLYYFFLEGNHWRATTPFTAAGNVQGCINAKIDPATKRSVVSVRGQNGQTYVFTQQQDYSWKHDGIELNHGVAFSNTIKTNITLEMHLHMPKKITNIYSPTNKIQFSVEETRALFSGPIVLEGNQDFVAIIETDKQKNRMWVNQVKDGEMAAMAVFYPPELPASVQYSGEIVFLLDRSGSMGETTMNAAKEAVQLFLRSLPVTCSFNIIAFDDSLEHLFAKSQPFNETTFSLAKIFVASIRSRGGTELLEAVKFVTAEKSGVKKVILLTDGAVFNTDQVISFAKQQSVIIYSLGIGSAVSTALVNGIARETGGQSEFVIPGEAMDEKVIRQLKRAMSNGVMNANVDWGTPLTQLQLVAPSHVSFFAGDRIVSNAIFKAGTPLPTNVRLNVLMHDGTHVSYEAPLATLFDNTTMLHALAAKKYMQDAESKTDQVIATSIKYHVLSKHTGMVGVGKEVVKDNSTEQITVAIPVQTVKEWNQHMASFSAQLKPDRLIYGSHRDGDIGPAIQLHSASLSSAPSMPQQFTFNDIPEGPVTTSDANDNSLDESEEEEDDDSGAGPPNELTIEANAQPAAAKSVPNNMILELVRMQAWNGTWSLNEEFARTISVPLQDLQKLPHTCKDASLVATAIAHYYLQKHGKKEHELVRNKAHGVLQQDACWHQAMQAFGSK